MAQKGAQIYNLDGQLGIKVVVSDAIKGLITNGVVTAEYDTLGTVKRITGVKDAEALGINAAYDANNNCLVYESIKEFFRLQPEGILYFMIVDNEATQLDMIQTHWPALLASDVVWKNERISSVALKRNTMDDEYEPVQEDGYWDEVLDAINAWDTVNATLEQQGIYGGVVVLDGSYCDDTADLTNLRLLNNAPGCAVCIGQDPMIVNTNPDYFANYADTAAMLGIIAQRKACESMGALKIEVPPAKYRGQNTVSMTDTLTGRWMKSQLSNGQLLNELTPSEFDSLNAKGVNYFDRVYNYAGMYGVNGATVVEIVSDFAYIERYEILQKAKHLAYQFFTPLKNSVVDIKNGKLTEEKVAYLENEATNAVLGQLLFEGNISPYDGIEGAGVILPQDYNFITGEHETDPLQNVEPETLVVRMGIPIRGILRNITIYVGLKA